MADDHQHNPPRTILFQPPNHIGLGHVNRLAAVALALREIDASARTLFVVEGGAHVLLDALDLPYVPLPSEHAMNETDSWTRWSQREKSYLSTAISQTILRTVKPQAVVFDCLPNEAFISATLENQVPAVLCLRQMRFMDDYCRYLGNLATKFDLVLVPHDANAFELPEDLRKNAHFVGEIARKTPFQTFNGKSSNAPRIVISGGGGGFPNTVTFYNLASKVVAALRTEYPNLQAQLIAGPLFGEWSKLESRSGISVIPFEPDLAGAFARADLVICQAGYNTVAEVRQSGSKAILVPAKRTWDDQFARAQRACEGESRFRVHLSPDCRTLAELALELLRSSPVASPVTVPPGAERAAMLLHAMMGQLSSRNPR